MGCLRGRGGEGKNHVFIDMLLMRTTANGMTIIHPPSSLVSCLTPWGMILSLSVALLARALSCALSWAPRSS